MDAHGIKYQTFEFSIFWSHLTSSTFSSDISVTVNYQTTDHMVALLISPHCRLPVWEFWYYPMVSSTCIFTHNICLFLLLLFNIDISLIPQYLLPHQNSLYHPLRPFYCCCCRYFHFHYRLCTHFPPKFSAPSYHLSIIHIQIMLSHDP